MEQQRKNKEFIINYFNAMAEAPSPVPNELLKKYISDDALIGHIRFFEKVFPNYEVVADEMTAEGNRVIVRGRTIGTHLGEFEGIPPTYKTINHPFVICYEIENEKIVSHWMLADKMTLMEQL